MAARFEQGLRRALLLIAVVLGACTTPLTGMVHPVTGEVRTCTSHLAPGLDRVEMSRCVETLRASGFVKAEELTNDQRAALLERGRRRPGSRGAAASGTGEPGSDEAAGDPSRTQPGIWRRVTMVLDAETLILDGGQTLRYLGIRPVESPQSPTAVGRFAEAVAFNRQLAEGQAVRLEFDVRLHDPDGRLWAYVYLQDGRMANALLVERGYAQADPYQSDLKHAQLFQQLEAAARAAGQGFWGLR